MRPMRFSVSCAYDSLGALVCVCLSGPFRNVSGVCHRMSVLPVRAAPVSSESGSFCLSGPGAASRLPPAPPPRHHLR